LRQEGVKLKTLFLYFVFNFLGLIIAMTASAATHLAPCPSSPNCVSSQATDKHFIKPLTITGKPEAAFEKLKEILARRPDTTIISADEKIILVEFRTTLGFVDDGIFELDAGNRVINIRSASRIGYYDFGKNRRRMEEIRKEYQSQGMKEN
jgi:uncharacterized protein (DUF1499 family)